MALASEMLINSFMMEALSYSTDQWTGLYMINGLCHERVKGLFRFSYFFYIIPLCNILFYISLSPHLIKTFQNEYVCVCVYIYINPKSRQRQLKSYFIKTLFESKKNITFHCLQQLVHIYDSICEQAAVSSETYFLRFYFQIKF